MTEWREVESGQRVKVNHNGEIYTGTIVAERHHAGYYFYRVLEDHPLAKHYHTHPKMQRHVSIVPEMCVEFIPVDHPEIYPEQGGD